MSIKELKKELGVGASRAKYEVYIPIPMILRGLMYGSSLISKIPLVGGLVSSSNPAPDSDTIRILAKSTSFPEKTVGVTDVFSRGIKYEVRGVAEFPNRWDVTFYNTQDLALRNFFEEWMHQIDSSYVGSGSSTTFINNYFGVSEINSGYMTDIEVSQLNCKGSKSATYTIYYAFPVGISAVDLDVSRPNEISDFTVTFAYTNWRSQNPSASKLENTVKNVVDFLF
jgi:hypothetical protein